MRLAKTANFDKRYQKLPKSVQKQVDKQISYLEKDFYHPSLHSKKMSGFTDWWEFRISKGYRMIGKRIDNSIILHTVGPHDIGLGKR